MKSFLLPIFLLGFFIVNGQHELFDSLQNELKRATSPEKKIDILNNLSYSYSQVSLPLAEQFAIDALNKSVEIQYQEGIGSAHNNLGIIYSIQGHYNSGMDHFIKSLRIREERKDFALASRTLNNIARIFIYQKNYSKAIEYSHKALELLKNIDDPRAIGYTYMIMGSLYADMNENTKELDAYKTALIIYQKAGLKPQQGQVLLNIAGAYVSTKKYDEALEVCLQATTLLDLKADLFTSIQMQQTIGRIHSGKGDLKSASEYLHNALSLADKYNDSNGRISSRLQLSQMYKTFSQPDSALYYYEAYSNLNMEIFNRDKASQIATLEKVYETRKKDEQLELNKQKIEAQNTIIFVVSALLFVIAAMGALLYRYSLNKRKTNVSLVALNKDISEKNEEILAQSEELVEANNEIRMINDNLEKEVQVRTEKIKIQNQKLLEYAYSNAHNVRGPLARILGLAMLMEKETSTELILDYNKRLHQCAIELDEVIGEINKKLEEGF